MAVPSPLGGTLVRWSMVFLFAGSAAAQTSPPRPVSTALAAPAAARQPLDRTLAEIGKGDAELIKKIDGLRANVDAEALAGRLAEPLAQSLRWSLRVALPSSGVDFGTIINSSRWPVENAQLMEHIKSLEGQWLTAQQQRNTLLQAALTEARVRVGEAAHSAEKLGDVDPLIASLDRLQDAAQNRNSSAGVTTSASNFTTLATFLRSLRRVIEVEAEHDAITVGSALSAFHNSIFLLHTIVNDSDVQQRLQRGVAPFQKAQEDAQEALDNAFSEKTPAADLSAALSRFEEAVEQNQQVRSGLNLRSVKDTSSLVTIYRNLAGLANAMQSNDFTRARALMSNARDHNLQPLGATRSAAFSARIAAWEKALADARQEAATKRRQLVATRLDAVKTPADLESLAAELARGDPGKDEERDEWSRALGLQLNALAAGWTGATPQLIRQSYGDLPDAQFAVEMGKLRQRIEREVLSRSLKAPELLQPPLAELPTEAALDKLSAQMAAAGEWRRLLLLVDARNPAGRSPPYDPREVDLGAAVRAYLAGRNLELAEQWSDAIQSYKTALRSTDERAPTTEAAERVKALSKSHPDASPTLPTRALPAP